MVAAKRRALLPIEAGQRSPEDDDLSLVRVAQPREQMEKRGLARARRPGDRDELAREERGVEPVEDETLLRAAAV